MPNSNSDLQAFDCLRSQNKALVAVKRLADISTVLEEALSTGHFTNALRAVAVVQSDLADVTSYLAAVTSDRVLS